MSPRLRSLWSRHHETDSSQCSHSQTLFSSEQEREEAEKNFVLKLMGFLQSLLCTYQLFTQMISSLSGNIERSLGIVVWKVRTGSGAQQQSHGFWLVLDDTIMKWSVSFLRLAIKAGGVLNKKINNMQRAACFLGNSVMKTGLLEFLQNKTLQKLFQHAITNNISTYAVGKRIREITA